MEKNNIDIAGEVYKSVKERASKMYLAGNPPKVDWWLERLEEGLAKVLDNGKSKS